MIRNMDTENKIQSVTSSSKPVLLNIDFIFQSDQFEVELEFQLRTLVKIKCGKRGNKISHVVSK